MLLHVLKVEVVGDTLLSLRFSHGIEKTVDVHPLLKGPIFEPLRDPDVFRLATLDPIAKTVSWPNGADLAPEALEALPAVQGATQKAH